MGVAEAAALPETPAPPVKRKRGESGMPTHVQPIKTVNDGTKFFARLSFGCHKVPQRKSTAQCTIPGLYDSPAAAVEALVAATERYESSGADAVWPKGLPGAAQGRARGEMRRTGRHIVLPWSRRLPKGQRRRLHAKRLKLSAPRRARRDQHTGSVISFFRVVRSGIKRPWHT